MINIQHRHSFNLMYVTYAISSTRFACLWNRAQQVWVNEYDILKRVFGLPTTATIKWWRAECVFVFAYKTERKRIFWRVTSIRNLRNSKFLASFSFQQKCNKEKQKERERERENKLNQLNFSYLNSHTRCNSYSSIQSENIQTLYCKVPKLRLWP